MIKAQPVVIFDSDLLTDAVVELEWTEDSDTIGRHGTAWHWICDNIDFRNDTLVEVFDDLEDQEDDFLECDPDDLPWVPILVQHLILTDKIEPCERYFVEFSW